MSIHYRLRISSAKNSKRISRESIRDLIVSDHRWLTLPRLQDEHADIVNLADSRMDCSRVCLATLSVLVVRIVLLEYMKRLISL